MAKRPIEKSCLNKLNEFFKMQSSIETPLTSARFCFQQYAKDIQIFSPEMSNAAYLFSLTIFSPMLFSLILLHYHWKPSKGVMNIFQFESVLISFSVRRCVCNSACTYKAINNMHIEEKNIRHFFFRSFVVVLCSL